MIKIKNIFLLLLLCFSTFFGRAAACEESGRFSFPLPDKYLDVNSNEMNLFKEMLDNRGGQAFTQNERDIIFRLVEQLYRQSWQHINEGEEMAAKIPDFNTRNICYAAIAGAIKGIKGGSVWSVVIDSALTAMGMATIQAVDYYRQAYELTELSFREASTAEYWEERLWADE